MSTSVTMQSNDRVKYSNGRTTVMDERGDRNYPLSRFALRPLAAWAAYYLASSRVRPEQVTFVGAGLALLAAVMLGMSLVPAGIAAALVLVAWFCDRLDGALARRQGTVSAWGAWIDANLDELADIGLHAAIAAAAAAQLDAQWPWGLLLSFVAGKYLFMYGLSTEVAAPASREPASAKSVSNRFARLRDLYHLPANADVRVHVLVLALAWNALVFELAWVAAYYNLRWIARYVLVARRLREGAR